MIPSKLEKVNWKNCKKEVLKVNRNKKNINNQESKKRNIKTITVDSPESMLCI